MPSLPKNMPPAKTLAPAAELQDAVSVFMKAANHALASVEESSKEDLRRALHDAREAQKERDEMRRERDASLQEKLSVVVELEVAKRDSERSKAATEKAEWMINHQAETITQLRRESQQWKDQFMRVDEERLRLSGRNDELVSQQLYANRRENAYHQEPLTPRSQGPQTSGRATSSNQYASTSTSAMGYATEGDILNRRTPRDQSYTHAQTPRAKASRNTGAHAKSQPVASSSRRVSHLHSTTTPGKVLRTVHVVMQGGQVKEESLDSVALAAPDSNTGSESLGEEEEVEEEVQPQPSQTQKQKPKQAIGKRKAALQGQSARRKWSEDKRIYDDDDESGNETASVENEDEYVPPAKSRAVDDEDEDELMLGGEVDRHETYGAEKISEARTPARRAQTQPAKQSSGSVRKRNSPYPPNTSKAGNKTRRIR